MSKVIWIACLLPSPPWRAISSPPPTNPTMNKELCLLHCPVSSWDRPGITSFISQRSIEHLLYDRHYLDTWLPERGWVPLLWKGMHLEFLSVAVCGAWIALPDSGTRQNREKGQSREKGQTWDREPRLSGCGDAWGGLPVVPIIYCCAANHSQNLVA